MQKLFQFEIDQSIRIEELNKDTILGLANKEKFYAVIISAKTKRRLFEIYRLQGRRKQFAPFIFAAAIVLILQKSGYKFYDIIIDIEYPGYELKITDFIKKFFPEINIYFSKIGKNSAAHYAAYGVYIGKIKINNFLNFSDLFKIIKNDSRTVTYPDKPENSQST